MKRLILFSGFLILSLGCTSIIVPEYEGPITDHYDGDQFFNIDPSSDKSFWTVMKWRWSRKPVEWPKYISVAQGKKPVENVTDQIRLTFINHSTVLIQVAELNFLIDPVWSQNVGPTSWLGPDRHHLPGIAFADLPKIDFVLVSHNHYDHLDLPTLEKLRDHSNPVIFGGLGTARFLNQDEIKNGLDLDWWQTQKLYDRVAVHGTPARHWSMRSWGNRRQVLWMGYVIETPKGKIFYAGDTGWGSHFDLIYQKYGKMDVCILPIGAYLPRWFMKENHLSPDEAVQAHKLLGCKKSLGVHFGTFQQSDEYYGQPEKDLADAVKKEALREEDFRTLKPGEFWEIQ